jgi:hypothetical protein
MRKTRRYHRIADNVAQNGTGISKLYLEHNYHAYLILIIKENEMKFLCVEDGGNRGRPNGRSTQVVK